MREIKFRTWTGTKMHYGNSSIADKTDWPLMQFTGLKDREGKEIWEGDVILRDHPNGRDKEKFSIIYDNAGFILDFIVKPKKWKPQYDIVSHEIEVLGNIWESPELLEQK